MSRDFTLAAYARLLESIKANGYKVCRVREAITESSNKLFILRHDVDRKPQNALATAQLQADLGLMGTYYFRIVPESFQPQFIEGIARLGHEIGYHYEDLSLCKGDTKAAIEHFESSLERLRSFAPVDTVCMHGSPMTKWDNRDIWKHYNYRDFGIIAEPYFDFDFSTIYYLTDTGRRWDGAKVSVRDSVSQAFNFSVHSTQELIEAINAGKAPDKILQNIHPERWTDRPIEWAWEATKSAIKNPTKQALKYLRK